MGSGRILRDFCLCFVKGGLYKGVMRVLQAVRAGTGLLVGVE